MKRVKNYIPPDLAKKKIARYKYWNIKDESGISITSSEDNAEGRSFAEILDTIIGDNVDAEIQVKFGTNEQSSRQNAPIFIRINETIEWIEPEEEETISINGVPHRVDKNGKVNINLNTPKVETPTIEGTTDYFRQEMELQLEGLRKETELKEQKFQAELHNKLMEQTLKFKEMMLTDREARIQEREQTLAQQEIILDEKQAEMKDGLKSYVKMIPETLGGVVSEWIKGKSVNKKSNSLGTTKGKAKVRNKVKFSYLEDDKDDHQDTEETQDSNELINDIAVYDEEILAPFQNDTPIPHSDTDHTILTDNTTEPSNTNTDENI